MISHKKKSNIVLIGFMGSGKSSSAQALKQRLGFSIFSTDSYVEEKQKRSISEIFQTQGEAHFRQLEHEAVKELSKNQGVIIDCGGGVVLNPENIKLLREDGVIFYLKASPEIIYERIKDQKHRPLLAGDNPLATIKELLTKRLPLYAQADFTIDANDKNVLVPVEEIIRRFQGQS